MLVVTTAQGVLHRVYCHTTHMESFVSLQPEIVVRASGLGHGLVNRSVTHHDAHNDTAIVATLKAFSSSSWKIITAWSPEQQAKVLWLPTSASTEETTTPSVMEPKGGM